MTDRLTVYFGLRTVGSLTNSADGFLFEYAPSWLDDKEGFSISITLPRSAKVDPVKARSFFSNLLPEASVRTLVCRRLGVSEGNDFALLKAIGGECAGALTIVEEAKGPLDRDDEYELLSKKRLAALARSYEALPAVDGRGRVRLSLAGAQDKLPVYEEDGRFYLPLGNSPSTHILKFPNRHFKHLPANEVLLSELARRVGLSVARARWERIGDEGLCAVERYDRVRDEHGEVSRIHQEDFCQALGVPPIAKYEQEGGPALLGCVELVRDHGVEPLIDTQALLRWSMFNVVAGNADGHAKNLSLLWHDGWRLCPFYDLVCTRVYPRIDRHMAMTIGGERDPDKLRRPQLEACARELGIGRTWLVEVMRSVAGEVVDGLAEAIAAAAVADSPIATVVSRQVKKQARRILRELAVVT
jgi:serine/threonine-protein kinase HipA